MEGATKDFIKRIKDKVLGSILLQTAAFFRAVGAKISKTALLYTLL